VDLVARDHIPDVHWLHPTTHRRCSNSRGRRSGSHRHPYESIPRRVFLDTNVLNVLVKHSEHVFELVPIPDGVNRTLAEDIQALMFVFAVSARASWDILASEKTLDEIRDIPDSLVDLRDELLDYGVGLVNARDEHSAHAARLGRLIVDAPFVAALPDVADRELIGNAIGFGCDAFVTCDRSTIVKKRERLRQLPIRVMTPREWWERAKPWAGLWC
jgi:hypothetical protein